MSEDDKAAEGLAPEVRSFLAGLSETMDQYTEMRESVEGMVASDTEYLIERLGTWSPEMRLGTALVIGDIMERWQEVSEYITATLAQTDCGDAECEVHGGSEEQQATLMVMTLWANVSTRLKVFVNAIEQYGPEISETSQKCHDAGYGRHDND